MIKFENFYVKFVNEFYSVFDANFIINNNTILVEKNLCGCTAIFRTLTKLLNDYQGEIFIDETNLKTLPKKNLDIAFLPENFILFNNKSIKSNLEFPLKIRKINKKIRKNAVNSIFSRYNLNKFDKNIKNLSTTEKKIICLLRTYIRKPKYVLMENFFENFDEKYIEFACEILEDLKKNSTLIVSEKTSVNLNHFKDFDILEI